MGGVGLPQGLNPFPEGEVTACGMREEPGVPGPAAPGDGDACLGEGGLDGTGFDQPRTDERTII